MKKTTAFLLVFVLALTLLCGCGQKAAAPGQSEAPAEAPAAAPEAQTDQTSEAAAPEEAEDSAESSVNMTESYRAGRQAYYDVTGIWMPEVAKYEAEYEVNYEQKSICFDSHGDRAMYEMAWAILVKEFGEPESDDGFNAVWKIPEADGRVAVYDIYYDDNNPGDPWVYMNVHRE